MQPYRTVISEAAGAPVNIYLKQRMSVMLANAPQAQQFDVLFADSQAQRPLVDSIAEPGNAGKDLLDTAFAVMSSKPVASPLNAVASLRKLGNLDYVFFEDVGGYRGVCLQQSGENLVKLVGLSRGPMATASKEKPRNRRTLISDNAAMRVSAAIIAEVASRF